ncbi:hypothetical protein AAEO56_16565 [Flavobacterium sp. DGU11]|uniref:Uncharacterized protein n=1 Tax=Flavobacterium arundinis TaxID=3139143 RepID=A0ABU9I1I9_9FLAO
MSDEQTLIAGSNISTAKKTFWWSLGIGTALELAFLITDWAFLLVVGFYYVAIAFMFNLIVFLNNIIFVCLHREKRMALILYTLLLLLNIPITFLYLNILFINH